MSLPNGYQRYDANVHWSLTPDFDGLKTVLHDLNITRFLNVGPSVTIDERMYGQASKMKLIHMPASLNDFDACQSVASLLNDRRRHDREVYIYGHRDVIAFVLALYNRAHNDDLGSIIMRMYQNVSSVDSITPAMLNALLG